MKDAPDGHSDCHATQRSIILLLLTGPWSSDYPRKDRPPTFSGAFGSWIGCWSHEQHEKGNVRSMNYWIDMSWIQVYCEAQ